MRILKNPATIGTFTSVDVKTQVEGYYPAVIDRAVFFTPDLTCHLVRCVIPSRDQVPPPTPSKLPSMFQAPPVRSQRARLLGHNRPGRRAKAVKVLG